MPGAAGPPGQPPAAGRPRRRLRDVLARRSPDDLELGDGLWRRAHDRFRRAVDRYHQVLEPVPPGALRDALERDGARLAACLDAVRATCAAAHAASPRPGLEVPGGEAGRLHARLSRAGTLAAQAAEAVTMARVRARADPSLLTTHAAGPGGPGGPRGRGASGPADAVDRAVAQVEALLAPPVSG